MAVQNFGIVAYECKILHVMSFDFPVFIFKQTRVLASIFPFQKFGVFEGQPSAHLIKAAREARSNISSYVPEGGESSQEVRSHPIS